MACSNVMPTVQLHSQSIVTKRSVEHEFLTGACGDISKDQLPTQTTTLTFRSEAVAPTRKGSLQDNMQQYNMPTGQLYIGSTTLTFRSVRLGLKRKGSFQDDT